MMLPMSKASDILDEVTEAYRAALSGKNKRYNGREVTKHDLPVLRKEMQHWQNVVASENGGGHRPIRMVL